MGRAWWRVMTKWGPLEKGMVNHLSILALKTSWTAWKGKKIWHWKMSFPGRQVPNMLLEKSGEITQKEWRHGAKPKTMLSCDVTGDGSKVRCCKEQYCIGTWKVGSKNQGKLEVVKQEMAWININILRISELKWTGMGKFTSDDHYIYYCGQRNP